MPSRVVQSAMTVCRLPNTSPQRALGSSHYPISKSAGPWRQKCLCLFLPSLCAKLFKLSRTVLAARVVRIGHTITMTTPPYSHSPLDPADPRAIRIIQLLPSRDLKGPVRCELYHCSLDDNYQFEAISYTWGAPEPGYTVLVNGSCPLEVTPNCVEALVDMRRRFHKRTLWIDSICIDQRQTDTSKRERDRQVRIMGDVYRAAQKVLVWLGPAEPGTARTISRLRLLAKLENLRESRHLGSSAFSTLEKYLFNRMGK